MRKDRKKPYTLIEIVTVIAIAAIVITLIGVSFENLGGSSNVDAATAEVGNALSLAKSQAASRRKYVALVIVNPALAGAIEKVKERPFGSYRLAYVKKPTGDNGTAEFVGWIPAQDWTVLPPATAILSIGGSNLATTKTPLSNYDSPSVVTITDLPNSLPNTKGLVFSPKGVLYPTHEVKIIVTRAMVGDNNTELDFQNASNSAEDSKMLRINQYTGVISYEAAP